MAPENQASKRESADIPDGEKLPDHEPPKFMLKLAPFELEHLIYYERGLLHPVRINNVFNNRYRVIHKLGHGGFGTVWLCHDSEEPEVYKALKIMASDEPEEECREVRGMELKAKLDAKPHDPILSTALCLPLDKFDVRGPNGVHVALVYPILGSKSSHGRFNSAEEDRDKVSRAICYRVTQAVAYLHSEGICHGDISPHNTLQCIVGLNGKSESEVLEILGQPRRNPVLPGAESTDTRPEGVPPYLVYPVNWDMVDEKYISTEPSLIDLGESFHVSSPPEDLGTPTAFRAPELLLETKPGIASDLWALGCTLFAIRTGRKLFAAFDDDDDAYLDLIVRVLGPLPEPWWSTTWGVRKEWYEDKPDEQGRAVSTGEPVPDAPNSHVHPGVAHLARSLREKVAAGVWYMDSETLCAEKRHRDIEEGEIDLFADLLGRLMRYVPQERISAQEALSHEWFSI